MSHWAAASRRLLYHVVLGRHVVSRTAPSNGAEVQDCCNAVFSQTHGQHAGCSLSQQQHWSVTRLLARIHSNQRHRPVLITPVKSDPRNGCQYHYAMHAASSCVLLFNRARIVHSASSFYHMHAGLSGVCSLACCTVGSHAHNPDEAPMLLLWQLQSRLVDCCAGKSSS